MTAKIPTSESMTVELKSDRDRISDDELVLTAVCLANSEGGQIYVGVEDDGAVTGLHRTHRGRADGLGAMIHNKTQPPLSVETTSAYVEGREIAIIDVPRMSTPVATAKGTLQRRRLKADGTPECVPFLPHEFVGRASRLLLVDPSALPVSGATRDDLDPVERARIRQFVERFHGDQALLSLDDDELDGALSLTTRREGRVRPTLAGLLLIGRESSLRALVPAHEIAFQVLDGEDVRINEFTRAPLLRAFEWLDTMFAPLNVEQELQVGLFRVPIPLVDRRAFREALANALTHRDYGRLGAVHVRLETDALVVSNPGGFVEGVTLSNLLTTEPRPRNPVLADALKRVGLVERTGRGVDLIFRGLLRYGRPRPDYSRSDEHSVVLRLPTIAPDLAFLEMILEEEQASPEPLPTDAFIALATLREQRRVTRADIAQAIQKEAAKASAVLAALVERGLVEAHGTGRGTTYTLSASIYAARGQRAEYTLQASFDDLQQEQLVRNFVNQHGEICRADVVRLCRLSPHQASRRLRRLTDAGVLMAHRERRWRYYTAGPAMLSDDR